MMERFVIIVNGWKPLAIISKRSILDVAAVLDSPLLLVQIFMVPVVTKLDETKIALLDIERNF